MTTFEYTIKDAIGIHARPAGKLVETVRNCDSRVNISCRGNHADAAKLMSVLGLGVKSGDTVIVSVEGGDEYANTSRLRSFFETNL